MRFYFENSLGDCGYFSETNLIKAIFSAWNIDADLWLLNDGLKKIDFYSYIRDQAINIFSPLEGNEYNSDVLKKFGYYMTDGDKYREIRRIDNIKVVQYDWDKVKQLI